MNSNHGLTNPGALHSTSPHLFPCVARLTSFSNKEGGLSGAFVNFPLCVAALAARVHSRLGMPTKPLKKSQVRRKTWQNSKIN